jgi:cell division GTPase FtsZ
MLICEDLLCILQDKYKNISEELFPELKNDNIEKGFITLDKTDIKNALINSKNCTFNVVKAEKKDALNIFINSHNIDNTKNLILFIIHDKNLTLYEISEIISFITKNINSSTNNIVGDFKNKTVKNNIKLVSLNLE